MGVLQRLFRKKPRAQLKKMAQGANLATATDLKGLKKDGVIAVLIKRGREKIKERRL